MSGTYHPPLAGGKTEACDFTTIGTYHSPLEGESKQA